MIRDLRANPNQLLLLTAAAAGFATGAVSHALQRQELGIAWRDTQLAGAHGLHLQQDTETGREGASANISKYVYPDKMSIQIVEWSTQTERCYMDV